MSMNYQKPVLNVRQQVELLQSRGLIIQNENEAEHYLQFISYYRLSGYTIVFEKIINGKRNHQFKDGTTFENILDLYDFDRRLRMLVMDALERIEVAIRTQICLALGLTYNDSHWHLRRELFQPKFNFYSLLSKCENEQEKSKELFAIHYKNTYDSPVLLPSWMMIELLSMGTWSHIYKNLTHRSDKKRISDKFKLSPIEFESWLHSLTYIRNLCAHHSRLWNRQFTITPKKHNDKHNDYKKYFIRNTTFATQAAMMHLLLKIISPNSRWTTHLYKLIKENTFISSEKMGFIPNWHNDKFWEVQTK